MSEDRASGDSPEWIGLKAVSEVLKKCLQTDQFILKSFTMKPAGDGLLGFLGNHSILTVEYVLDGNNQQMTAFVKTVPRDNKSRTDFANNHGMFAREAYVFNNIFSIFPDDEESIAWRPKCFLSIENDLIMEDIGARGFKMLNHRIPLNKEDVLVALTTLARFHAATFKLEESISTKTNKKYRLCEEFELTESVFAYNPWFKICMNTALTIATEKSKKYGKGTPYVNMVEQNWGKHSKEGILMCGPSKKVRNILCHSDLWNNNLMFRLDENGRPVQCMLVDFQACRFSTPASDVMSLIYLNVDKRLRDTSMEEFIKHYYEELKSILLESNLLIESLLPWSTYRESCEVCKKWGLVQSMTTYQFCFLDSKDALEHISTTQGFEKLVNESGAERIIKTLKDGPILTERFLPTIEEFIETYIVKV